jgi:hypothetical protein
MAQTLIVTAPAKLGTISTLVDGTVRAQLYISKELPADEMTTLFELAKQGEGWFLFSPNPIEPSKIPKKRADAQFDGKTPSQVQYNTIYRRWIELTDQSKPFDLYYIETMAYINGLLRRDLPVRP